MRGRLYHFPALGYPGVVDNPQCWVHGSVLHFTEGESVLKRLDWLEDYDARRDPSANEYQRVTREIFTTMTTSDVPSEGLENSLTSLGQVWTYIMLLPTIQRLGGVLIPDGHWPPN